MHLHSFHLVPGQRTQLSPVGLKVGRYRCACGVFGRLRGSRVVAVVCAKEMEGRRHCGKDAVHVEGQNGRARCAEHAPAQTASSAA